jgi:hypothetical protein
MKFRYPLLIIISFLTLAYSVNAQTTQITGNTLLNFSVYEAISADSAMITVNVTANDTFFINATNTTSTTLDFVSNTTLGNISIIITRYLTYTDDISLSGLNVAGFKYVNITANNTLNSSVLAWNLIKIYYTNTELDAAGIVEDSLSMYRYNTTSSQWVKLNTSLHQVFETGVNTTAKYVWVNLTFFSFYAITGLKANSQSCSANAECYSNICCNGICQSSCTTTVPTGSGRGGAGGGGATTIKPEKISSFTLSEDLIKILLKPGDSQKRLINISNVGERNLSIIVNMENLENFLIFPSGVSEYGFDLIVGKTKSIQLNFFTSKEQKSGIYPGKIIITGDGIEKIIAVLIEIESEKPLFDIDVEIPEKYKEVLPGGQLLAQLTIYNIKRMGRVDVDVEYGLKDFSGNIIINEHETLAVEMQVSILKSLNVPYEVKPGNYVFYAIVKYDNTTGIGTDILRVVKKETWIQTTIILALVLIIGIMISIFLLTIRFVERKIKKLSRHIGKIKL